MPEGDPGAGLEELDLAPSPPVPVPQVPGAAPAPPAEGPYVTAAEDGAVGATPPPRSRGRPRKLSGAARRKMAKEAAAGAARPPAAAQAPEGRPAKEVNAEGLELARKVIDDPDLLSWIEGLYRMPFELWARAVRVPEVVPTPARIERAARLIKTCMTIFGVKEWMKYLPLVFLVVAMGEDVALGVRAMQEAKQARGGTRPSPAPGGLPHSAAVAVPGPPETFPGQQPGIFASGSGPLPPGDPA